MEGGVIPTKNQQENLNIEPGRVLRNEDVSEQFIIFSSGCPKVNKVGYWAIDLPTHGKVDRKLSEIYDCECVLFCRSVEYTAAADQK